MQNAQLVHSSRRRRCAVFSVKCTQLPGRIYGQLMVVAAPVFWSSITDALSLSLWTPLFEHSFLQSWHSSNRCSQLALDIALASLSQLLAETESNWVKQTNWQPKRMCVCVCVDKTCAHSFSFCVFGLQTYCCCCCCCYSNHDRDCRTEQPSSSSSSSSNSDQ